ncbi:MAG: 50S ribosomal protein L1 [Bacteroidetes Order II. Incertae sedis bacterium]|jgi:large subunit ribosomal protein L1|nr:50S ribosomal protein L1 [Bacteroidetes Order II. bacterium]MDG1755131.1 50S ribosomal protein L1 [Rhodothermales bacterium]MBT4602418.1 50S ribosomal protein L1 [Bacteroidetes Order II. bacterium]MBT5250505.1 50S ribosomal protein L1 [Bacteroidetes Order II. bacterium]MBT6199986.1 50S ribosomal protein L1 [Bacteroidetes Order II. bacterium]
MAKKGKRYRAALDLIASTEGPIDVSTACGLLKQSGTAKFDESVDLDVRLGVDPRHADQMVRGTVALPHGTGKDVRVLVLANEGKQQEARDAGADHVGLDDMATKIQKEGWTDFDVVIATPDVMAVVGRLGRVLGPRGLMPNPKSGTVTMDLAAAIAEVKAGKIDFRVDKAGILHTAIGKASFSADQLAENAEAFLREIVRLRPAAAKGTYVRSITISTTMGPGIALDRSEVLSALR